MLNVVSCDTALSVANKFMVSRRSSYLARSTCCCSCEKAFQTNVVKHNRVNKARCIAFFLYRYNYCCSRAHKIGRKSHLLKNRTTGVHFAVQTVGHDNLQDKKKCNITQQQRMTKI